MTVISYGSLLVMGLLWAGSSLQAASAEDAAVGAERYEPVKPKYLAWQRNVSDLLGDGHEGWVVISTMVDAKGKPYETAVESSTGNPEFDRAAVKAVEGATMEPARLNGQPIESVFQVKVVFVRPNYGQARGAGHEFVKTYAAFGKALDGNDQASAAAILGQLKVTNLYEDAFLGLAQYRYAARYQDTQAQIAGLKRAIANEDKASYLAEAMFVPAMRTLFKLEVQTQYYGEALEIWQKLQKVDHDPQVIPVLTKVAATVEGMRSDPNPYAVAGELQDGRWFIDLMRNRFRIEVPQGHITDLKLRCEKKFVTFPYDPQIEYRIQGRPGKCQLQLTGEPGTLVKLIQS